MTDIFDCKPCSVSIKNCRFQGCVYIREGSEARIEDCYIHDHTALASKAAVSVCTGASLFLERTQIVNCRDRHPRQESRLPELLDMTCALWISGHVVVSDVTIVDNWPAGIVFAYPFSDSTAKLVVAGPVKIANNHGTLPPEQLACNYRRNRSFHSGNVCFPGAKKKLFHKMITSDGTNQGLLGLADLIDVIVEDRPDEP